MKKFQELYDFVDRAIRSRKYPDNTGASLKTALKLFESELNEEELNSIDEFSKNIEQIYQNVFSKNKNFTASSLAVYKSRVLKVITDYKKYGVDATKMASWSPKVIARTKKQSVSNQTENRSTNIENFAVVNNSFHTFDFAGGMKLIVPKTQKTTDAIMDGELKQIKVELKSFADKFCEDNIEVLVTNDKE